MEAVTSSTLKKTPVLLFQEKIKSTFVGTLQNKKPSNMGQIFELVYEAGDVPTGISTGQKDAKGRVIYDECTVKPGDVVSLFGNTQLDDKIGLQLPVGQRIAIVYKGLTPNPKTKRQFNDYFVGKLNPDEVVDLEALKK